MSQASMEVEALAKENANLFLAAKSWEREANIEADHVKELKAKLTIAVDALDEISFPSHPKFSNEDTICHNKIAEAALKQITEAEGEK